jgi:hypothetical protein
VESVPGAAGERVRFTGTGLAIRPSPRIIPFFLLSSLLFAEPAFASSLNTNFGTNQTGIYNVTYLLTQNPAVPWWFWIGTTLLGIGLLLLSFWHFPDGEEGLVSIMAWFPLGLAAYTSFAVEQPISYGATALINGTSAQQMYVMMESHVVYHLDLAGVGLIILTAFAIGNSYRIYVNQKRLSDMSTIQREDLMK